MQGQCLFGLRPTFGAKMAILQPNCNCQKAYIIMTSYIHAMHAYIVYQYHAFILCSSNHLFVHSFIRLFVRSFVLDSLIH